MNFYSSVFNVFNHNGYFGNVNNIYITRNFQIIPYKNIHTVLTNELHLLQYFLNYIFIGLRLAKTINPCINLSNINVLPNMDLSFCNIIKKNTMEYNFKNANIKMPLINYVTCRQGILNVLQEFNIISCKNYDIIKALINNNNDNSKKRQNPDYDDYDVKSFKRTKLLIKDTISDDFDEMQNGIETHMVMKYPIDSSNPFNSVINIWNVKEISNPHIDHTYRAMQNTNFNRKFTPRNRQNIVSCLIIYDEEIKWLEDMINNVARDILNLHQEYTLNYDLNISCQINDQIRKLKLYENFFKNKYASICESRNEIFHLYVNMKTSLNFNAEYISRTELEMHKKTREILYRYEQFYS